MSAWSGGRWWTLAHQTWWPLPAGRAWCPESALDTPLTVPSLPAHFGTQRGSAMSPGTKPARNSQRVCVTTHWIQMFTWYSHTKTLLIFLNYCTFTALHTLSALCMWNSNASVTKLMAFGLSHTSVLTSGTTSPKTSDILQLSSF